MFYCTYEDNIAWEVILNISQVNPFMIFVKIYPISEKFTMTKENKQATLRMNSLENLSEFFHYTW